MKIAVVGCNGQLGTDMVELLCHSAHTLLAVDLPDIDITREPSVRDVLGPFAPDAIVNCAAYTNVDACEAARDLAMAVNADGPRNLARFANTNGAWLFHISTDYVFSGDRPIPQPYTEEDATSPVSCYGITKLRGEEAVAEEHDRFTILRTAWLYGATGHNFLKAILKRALTGPDTELTVVNDQFGSPTWSLSLARQIVDLLENPVPGICHATSEGYGTWHQLASDFLGELGRPNPVSPCSTEAFPRPAKRPANSILENAQLKLAGRNRMPNWRDDLQRFVARHGDALMIECHPRSMR